MRRRGLLNSQKYVGILIFNRTTSENYLNKSNKENLKVYLGYKFCQTIKNVINSLKCMQ